MSYISMGRGPYKKLAIQTKPRTVTCPLCKRKCAPDEQKEGIERVVKNGKVVASVRQILAECCANTYLVSE